MLRLYELAGCRGDVLPQLRHAAGLMTTVSQSNNAASQRRKPCNLDRAFLLKKASSLPCPSHSRHNMNATEKEVIEARVIPNHYDLSYDNTETHWSSSFPKEGCKLDVWSYWSISAQ